MIEVSKLLHSTMRLPWGAAFIILLAAAAALVPASPRGEYVGGLVALSQGGMAISLQELRRLARRGDRKAQFALGQAYNTGSGVAMDHTKAVSWYRKSANQGYPPAQTVLGLMYYWGPASGQRVLAKNYAEAVKWFRLAAEQGFPAAQYWLGVAYTIGNGLPQDYEKAAQWYRRAAKQGYTRAQTALGVAHSQGKGVRQDYIEAYKWYTLAVRKGNRVAADDRDSLGARMTKDQIDQAVRLAQEFKSQRQRFDTAAGGQASSLSMAAVRDIQWRLRALGYDPGPVDGIPGKRTQSAVKAFQHDQALEPDGRLSKDLYARLKQIAVPVRAGSGFIVTRLGHLVTAHHVVPECDEIRIHWKKETNKASVVADDEPNDLALLQLSSPTKVPPARFRATKPVRLGEDTLVAGYPLAGAISTELNVSVGTVNALAGPGDDPDMLQLSAPLQSGYSGGPVLDRRGNVIGVVVGTTRAVTTEKEGVILQNVNWATKASAVRRFLQTKGIELLLDGEGEQLTNPEIAQMARGFTVAVECRRQETSTAYSR